MGTRTSTFVTTAQSTTNSTSTTRESSTSDSDEYYSSSTSSTLPPITALTTPFVQASDCISIWNYTSQDFHSYPSVIENTADSRQTSCRPSGWASRALSPAVCPESWTYYGISALSAYRDTSTSVATAATCCPSGYAPGGSYKYLNSAPYGDCTSWTKPHKGHSALTATGDDNHTTLFVGKGYVVRAAWTIEWAPSDVGKLSPQPPSVTADYGYVIPTWVPGDTAKQIHQEQVNDNGLNGLYQVFLGGVIAGPIGFVLCICCCVCCYRRSKRRAKNQAARPAEAVELGMTQRGIQTQNEAGEQRREAGDADSTSYTPAPRYSLDGAQDPAPPYQEPPGKASNLTVGPGTS